MNTFFKGYITCTGYRRRSTKTFSKKVISSIYVMLHEFDPEPDNLYCPWIHRCATNVNPNNPVSDENQYCVVFISVWFVIRPFSNFSQPTYEERCKNYAFSDSSSAIPHIIIHPPSIPPFYPLLPFHRLLQSFPFRILSSPSRSFPSLFHITSLPPPPLPPHTHPKPSASLAREPI